MIKPVYCSCTTTNISVITTKRFICMWLDWPNQMTHWLLLNHGLFWQLFRLFQAIVLRVKSVAGYMIVYKMKEHSFQSGWIRLFFTESDISVLLLALQRLPGENPSVRHMCSSPSFIYNPTHAYESINSTDNLIIETCVS